MIRIQFNKTANYIDFWDGIWVANWGLVDWRIDILGGAYISTNYAPGNDLELSFRNIISYE